MVSLFPLNHEFLPIENWRFMFLSQSCKMSEIPPTSVKKIIRGYQIKFFFSEICNGRTVGLSLCLINHESSPIDIYRFISSNSDTLISFNRNVYSSQFWINPQDISSKLTQLFRGSGESRFIDCPVYVDQLFTKTVIREAIN